MTKYDPIDVAVKNESSVVSDSDLKKAVDALQIQVNKDFGPVWGIKANLHFVGKSEADPSMWWLVVLDDSDEANALGYHDLNPNGLPLGKVFARSDIKNKSSWSVTCSHELLEMLADPDINLGALSDTSDRPVRIYSYEVCDACEADELGYEIDGVLVSDFVYPSWFESFHKPGSVQFDHQNKIKKPFELLKDGYISIIDLHGSRGWHDLKPGKTHKYDTRARVGSRRERRRTPRDQWLVSKLIESVVKR